MSAEIVPVSPGRTVRRVLGSDRRHEEAHHSHEARMRPHDHPPRRNGDHAEACAVPGLQGQIATEGEVEGCAREVGAWLREEIVT